MTHTKRLIVHTLLWTCTALDHIPRIYRHDNRWHWTRGGCWGCQLGFAQKSIDLDDRWKTGIWE